VHEPASPLRVDLSFRLIGVRGVDLQLPSEWEGIQNLYKAIRDIEVLSPQILYAMLATLRGGISSSRADRSSICATGLYRTGKEMSRQKPTSTLFFKRNIFSWLVAISSFTHLS
jgi:hypothetical protein